MRDTPSDRAIRQFSPVTGYSLDQRLRGIWKRIEALEAAIEELRDELRERGTS